MSDGGRPGWFFHGYHRALRETKPGSLDTPGKASMQILHPFAGSIQSYDEEISDPNRYRPDHCPQCEVKHPLTGHGFYCRTLVDAAFDGVIRVRRYLCRSCKRTVSLLPEFAFPWLRFSVSVIARAHRVAACIAERITLGYISIRSMPVPVGSLTSM